MIDRYYSYSTMINPPQPDPPGAVTICKGQGLYLRAALQFLARYRDDPRAETTLTWVTSKRLAYLMDNEAHWAQAHLEL